MINLLKSLNAWLLAWQRKHPIWDALSACVLLCMLVIGYVLVVCSQFPDAFSCSCDRFCSHQAFGCLGFILGSFCLWIGDIFANCFLILRSDNEAKNDLS